MNSSDRIERLLSGSGLGQVLPLVHAVSNVLGRLRRAIAFVGLYDLICHELSRLNEVRVVECAHRHMFC